jgi:photosystem II stability/assembly factor-like uncharacterized protein
VRASYHTLHSLKSASRTSFATSVQPLAQPVVQSRPVRTILLLLIFATSAFGQSWSIQTSGIDTNLRGVSVAPASASSSPSIVWACGSHGVILRSNDGGKTWARLSVPDASSLDFRSIQASGPATAYVMSIGPGPASRIYKTTDAGRHWTLEYAANRAAIFLDDLVCQSKAKCYAVSDPVDGKFLLLHADDGSSWRELPGDSMLAALPGEGVFAASGTSLAIFRNEIYFATGGASTARVFRSANLGRSWSVSATPVSSANASSGIFSVARRGNSVVVVGGDYKSTDRADRSAAYSRDAGATWKLSDSGPRGFRSAAAFLNGSTVIAVGPSGEDISRDGGARWTAAGSLNLNAVVVFGSQVWAVGPKGTIARMNPRVFPSSH